MKSNSDFRYDLEVGVGYENKLAGVLGLEKERVEVKRDFKATSTGNIFVEYMSRGKKSGISTSDAEWYCYWLSEEHLIFVTTKMLKALCRPYLNTRRDVVGGDSNTSKGILLPLTVFTVQA